MTLTPRAQESGSGNREGAWAYFCSGHLPSKDRCYFCDKPESYRHLLVEEAASVDFGNSYSDNSHKVSCCQVCTEWWYNALSMSLMVEADLG